YADYDTARAPLLLRRYNGLRIGRRLRMWCYRVARKSSSPIADRRRKAMEQVIAKLLEDFERGKMSRRHLIQTLAVAAVGSSTAPALGAEPYKMNAVNVNHISFGVADYARTRDFYVDLLGMKVSNDDGKQCYLHFGESILLARKTRQPDNKPFVDHICY